MVRLIPRVTKFFDLFAQITGDLGEAARVLKKTLEDFGEVGRARPAAQGNCQDRLASGMNRFNLNHLMIQTSRLQALL